MFLSIIILPLLGSIVSGFFGRKVGVRGAQIIACSCVIVTTILALLAFVEVGFNNIPVTINLFRWIDSEWINIIIGFQFDSLTVSMLLPVLIISSLVHIYSIGYMGGDPHNQRFFSYLSLFTFMMVILVTGNNYLLMFVGWEGVGVCSYLLVSFWFTRIAANQSSVSAFLTNRVGDCFLTIGMLAVLWSLGNLDYSTVFSLAPYINENVLTIIGICLVIGAMAKSSQVGLHVWLPMAMEGPTPVSALIHAATMVTAGVYLLMRSSPLIEYSSTVLLICLWLGAITTVFSSLVGLFQQDIKKVIAYSTMSQLGMMVIAIGLSSYNLALFHLVNHAFYKALLFLGAGAVIHAVADYQDFRKYGGLISFLPLTYSVILIASLSLVAFPFMTGFYSKDFILESAFGQFSFSGVAVYIIATIGAIFTTLYSVKVLYLTFLTNPNGPLNNYFIFAYISVVVSDYTFAQRVSSFGFGTERRYRERTYYPNRTLSKRGDPITKIRSISNWMAHEGDLFMMLPLIVLAVFSIFFGYVTKDIFLGLGTGFFTDNSIFIHPSNELVINTEFAVPTLFKLLPFFFTVSFSALAIIISEFLPGTLINFKFSRFGYNLFGFFNQRFLVEMFYNNYITNLVLYLGGQTTKVLDKGSVELIGPFGLEKALIYISKSLTKLSTGVVTSYALYILVAFILYVWVAVLGFASNGFHVLFILLLICAFSTLNEHKKNIINLGDSLCSVAFSSPYLQLSGLSLFSGFNGLSNNGIMYGSQFKNMLVYKGRCFYTNGSDLGWLSSASYSNRKIIDNLKNTFDNSIKDRGLSLEKDNFYLLYSKQIDKQNLLYKYPEILEIKKNLIEDFNIYCLELHLLFFAAFENGGKIFSSLVDIKNFIAKNNAGVIIPKESSFLEVKKFVLNWRNYNTPTFKDPTITPLVGTSFSDVSLSDKSPWSIYQQWVISLYMLTWEYNILNKVKLYLECKYDLYTDIDDIKDKDTIYWLNRQLKALTWSSKGSRYIVDFYSNKIAFYREIYEDISYVMLNIILGKTIIDSSIMDEFRSSDEFFIILTEIIREHYNEYREEYKYLDDLRRYSINHNCSATQLLEIYKVEKTLIKVGK
nr:NADH dehydrogenase subunit 5 [Valsa mali var. pyri (nom. inval.)]